MTAHQTANQIKKQITLPLGVVVRKTPGVTRWAKWCWRAVAVFPGAGPASWRELRREGEVVEYHAATLTLDLHHTQTEAYIEALRGNDPSIYVIMRPLSANAGDMPYEVTLVTASPFEAQDYCDSGEELVEKVPMPDILIALISDFVDAHHVHEAFQKRRRDKLNAERTQDGIGDPRISQTADVYRAPTRARKERLH